MINKEKSADDVYQMGDELRMAYDRIWKRLAQATLVWNESLIIFDNSENLNLANDTAPSFFRIVQEALWQEVNLEISRLTDPLKVGRRKTDGLRRLLAIAKEERKLQGCHDIDEALESAVKDCKPIRERRNQVLAHSDVSPTKAAFIPREEKDSTEKALHALAKFMNLFEKCVGLPQMMYSDIGFSPWGADQLIIALRKAQASEIRLHELVRTESDGRVTWSRLK